MIDPIKLATRRRKGILKDGKLLLSNLSVGEQKQDLVKTKGSVQGAVDDFYRVKTNIKAAPWEAYLKTGDSHETRDGKALMFDFNWWPMPELGGKPEDWNEVLLYQLKGCNIACPFCFVDRHNNNGKVDNGAKYFTTEEIVDAFSKFRADKAAEGVSINVLRASGGEPSLVPEQWLWTLQELDKRGLSGEVYLQSDTNLLTASAIEHWMSKGEVDGNVLREVSEYGNFGLLSCFKGTDPEIFVENTGCDASRFEEQFKSFAMYVDAGVRIYPHLVNPNPETLEGFMYRLAEEYGEQMFGMVHIFSIGMYGPVKGRFERRGVDVKAKAAEWKDNYSQSVELMEDICQRELGVGYKQTNRPEAIGNILG